MSENLRLYLIALFVVNPLTAELSHEAQFISSRQTLTSEEFDRYLFLNKEIVRRSIVWHCFTGALGALGYYHWFF